MNKYQAQLNQAIQASGCHPTFASTAFDRISQAFYGNRHFVDSISNIKIKLHPYGCIERLTAKVGIQIPDENKRGEGRLTYSFSVPRRKWKVKVGVDV